MDGLKSYPFSADFRTIMCYTFQCRENSPEWVHITYIETIFIIEQQKKLTSYEWHSLQSIDQNVDTNKIQYPLLSTSK